MASGWSEGSAGSGGKMSLWRPETEKGGRGWIGRGRGNGSWCRNGSGRRGKGRA